MQGKFDPDALLWTHFKRPPSAPVKMSMSGLTLSKITQLELKFSVHGSLNDDTFRNFIHNTPKFATQLIAIDRCGGAPEPG
jgi:hypothetical protein